MKYISPKQIDRLLAAIFIMILFSTCASTPPLHDAVNNNNAARVETLIQNGADVNLRYGTFSPLHTAVQKNLPNMVEILLNAGADIEVKEASVGATPLYIAAQEGHMEMGRLLLDRGANVDARQNEGATPLHKAAKEGYLPVARLLIARGANVNVFTKDKWTPLCLAVIGNHIEIVKLLLDHGAEINVKEGSVGATPLYLAAQQGYSEIAELLVKRGAAVDMPQNDGSTPLLKAAREGHASIVKMLLVNGADPNAKTNTGVTAVDLARHYGHSDIIRILQGLGVAPAPRMASAKNSEKSMPPQISAGDRPGAKREPEQKINRARRLKLKEYTVGQTTEKAFLADGFNPTDPLKGIIGIMYYEQSGDRKEFQLGYYLNPPPVDALSLQMTKEGWEYIRMNTGAQVTYNTPELIGVVRVSVCSLIFKQDVLHEKKCGE